MKPVQVFEPVQVEFSTRQIERQVIFSPKKWTGRQADRFFACRQVLSTGQGAEPSFEPWWSTPLLVLKTALRSIFDSSERFIIAGAFQKVQSRLHFQNICFFPSFLFHPGGSISWFKFSRYNMRSFSDAGVFVKLEFSWDLNFRESRKVQFHGNSSTRKLQFHGNVARPSIPKFYHHKEG